MSHFIWQPAVARALAEVVTDASSDLSRLLHGICCLEVDEDVKNEADAASAARRWAAMGAAAGGMASKLKEIVHDAAAYTAVRDASRDLPKRQRLTTSTGTWWCRCRWQQRR